MRKHLIPNVCIQRYIKELNEEGFEVFVHEDPNFPGVIYVTVRKNDIKSMAMMDPESYSDYMRLDYTLRYLAREVGNKLMEENKND